MYSGKKILEFTLKNTANTYTNYSSMKIVLPIQFTKKTNKTAQINDDAVTVNNFFRDWFTDIDIRRYPDDMRILPTNNSIDIYQDSNVQLKCLPKKAALIFLKTFLYCNKPVYLGTDVDRRPNNDDQSLIDLIQI